MSSFGRLISIASDFNASSIKLNPTEEETGKTYNWDMESFLYVFQHYSSVINKISANFELALFIGENLTSYVLDEYVNLMIEFFSLNDRIIPFIMFLIEREFKQSLSKEELFRQNNLCTKVLTAYARVSSKTFLNSSLKTCINKVINSPQSYEIDESKLAKNENIGTNLAALCLMCKEIINDIVKSQFDVPIEIRTICSVLWQNCLKYYKEDKELPYIIVGGFLFLRIFCPAIASPENFGLVGIETKVSPFARRKLILITKVLQNTANQVTETQEVTIRKTLQFSKDNIIGLKEYNRYISTQTVVLTYSDKDTSKFIAIEQVKMFKLFAMHQILYQVSIESERKNKTEDASARKTLEEVFDIIGTPPFLVTKKTNKSDREQSDLELVRMLDSEKIAYRGDSLANGNLVYYIVVRRFISFLKKLNEQNKQDQTTLEFIDVLIYLLSGATQQNKYIFVMDFSWFTMEEIREDYLINMTTSLSHLAQHQKDNFVKMYILHAGKDVKKVLEHMAGNSGIYGLSSGWNKAVEIVDDWQNLIKPFGETEILIPDTSKSYAKREFHALKVNYKGKAQDRIVLLTFDKLCNVDPISKSILNEIPLEEITEIIAYEKLPQVVFFCNKITAKEKKSNKEKTERLYALQNMAARESLLTQLYAICLHKQILVKTKLEYQIQKKGSSKKKKSKSIIVCLDRIIVVKVNTIVDDILFASIEKVYLVDNPKDRDTKILFIEYRSVKNGTTEKLTKKYPILKEDIKLKDLISDLISGDLVKTGSATI
ncbi:Ras GTPase-activating protein [Entamoeba marina]